MASTTQYILRREYLDSRKVQDERIELRLSVMQTDIDQLKTDVSQLKTDVSQLKTDVSQLKTDVSQLKTDVSQLKTDVNQLKIDVGNLKVEQRRSAAWMRNQVLKNPILPIQPIAIWDPTKGIIEPNPDMFPKHAKEFYSLRNPQTDRLRRKLQYLRSFYDVKVPRAASTTSTTPFEKDAGDDDDDNDADDDENILAYVDENHYAVQLLEGILGLSEDNFDLFIERARARAQQAQPPAPKRQQLTALPEEPLAHRPLYSGRRPGVILTAQDLMNSNESHSASRVSSSHAVLEWKEGPASSSLERQQQQDAEAGPASKDESKAAPNPVSESSGSTTNPNTNSPSPGRLLGRQE